MAHTIIYIERTKHFHFFIKVITTQSSKNRCVDTHTTADKVADKLWKWQ